MGTPERTSSEELSSPSIWHTPFVTPHSSPRRLSSVAASDSPILAKRAQPVDSPDLSVDTEPAHNIGHDRTSKSTTFARNKLFAKTIQEVFDSYVYFIKLSAFQSLHASTDHTQERDTDNIQYNIVLGRRDNPAANGLQRPQDLVTGFDLDGSPIDGDDLSYTPTGKQPVDPSLKVLLRSQPSKTALFGPFLKRLAHILNRYLFSSSFHKWRRFSAALGPESIQEIDSGRKHARRRSGEIRVTPSKAVPTVSDVETVAPPSPVKLFEESIEHGAALLSPTLLQEQLKRNREVLLQDSSSPTSESVSVVSGWSPQGSVSKAIGEAIVISNEYIEQVLSLIRDGDSSTTSASAKSSSELTQLPSYKLDDFLFADEGDIIEVYEVRNVSNGLSFLFGRISDKKMVGWIPASAVVLSLVPAASKPWTPKPKGVAALATSIQPLSTGLSSSFSTMSTMSSTSPAQPLPSPAASMLSPVDIIGTGVSVTALQRQIELHKQQIEQLRKWHEESVTQSTQLRAELARERAEVTQLQKEKAQTMADLISTHEQMMAYAAETESLRNQITSIQHQIRLHSPSRAKPVQSPSDVSTDAITGSRVIQVESTRSGSVSRAQNAVNKESTLVSNHDMNCGMNCQSEKSSFLKTIEEQNDMLDTLISYVNELEKRSVAPEDRSVMDKLICNARDVIIQKREREWSLVDSSPVSSLRNLQTLDRTVGELSQRVLKLDEERMQMIGRVRNASNRFVPLRTAYASLADMIRTSFVDFGQLFAEANMQLSDRLSSFSDSSRIQRKDKLSLDDSSFEPTPRVADIGSIAASAARRRESSLSTASIISSRNRPRYHTNVELFCRIRPSDDPDRPESAQNMIWNSELGELLLQDGPNRSCLFHFDRLFDPSFSTEDLFSDLVPLLPSLTLNKNLFLFAYGLPQSGKSFTLWGGQPAGQSPGLIELLSRQLLDLCSSYSERFSIRLTMSMVAVSQGGVFDCVANRPLKKRDTSGSHSGSPRTPSALYGPGHKAESVPPRPHTKEQEHEICSVEDIHDVMHSGLTHLESFMSKKLNDFIPPKHFTNFTNLHPIIGMLPQSAANHDSLHESNQLSAQVASHLDATKTHVVVNLHLRCANKETSVETHGKVCLVELAQPVSKNKNRLQDVMKNGSGHIRSPNVYAHASDWVSRSIGSLSDVLTALQGDAPTVPFEKSSLTQYLKNGLLRDASHVILLGHVNPDSTMMRATYDSLQLSAQAHSARFDTITRVDSDLCSLSNVTRNESDNKGPPLSEFAKRSKVLASPALQETREQKRR
eukprot:GILJ01009391.1.p1 GENE.GILJ01009391.1~~GILJ01009391.1.p1  ORF type:complete len:1319 (-),score=236.19 GILJ01009391.1:114-3986(-)